jgi:outer membrane protein OmpA-like peptidoglycan-associated protein
MHRRLLLVVPLLAGLAACVAPPAPAGGPQPVVVFFTADSALLDAGARAVVARAAQTARANPSAPVRVLGFAAPDTGTAAFNRTLAQARAQNVADGLLAAGVPRDRVRVESRGAVPFEMMPTESRRVDILIGT